MNLSGLTEAARCNKCGGYPIWCEICEQPDHASPHEEVTVRCPRCKDHPGIDPDVVYNTGPLPFNTMSVPEAIGPVLFVPLVLESE